ncbi:TetR/AcrR family transcriptional regulator [Vibrio tubiashii]|uniref:TetR/AcrR family transcriptional regulator n=1 Tax=Vibrio tubiashii TaxID=29498 RepID=UPI001EFEEA8B|nr:TetR/AcrR family transcriptional regulator [Vibrio tubiashii]MCG9579284.1 TetR/AcrR family transcriptional regulator [Vibrio tubiashii]
MKRKANTPSLSKALILDESLRLLAEKGIQAFSIRDLARRLETYPTAIYWYFHNKNALLGEIANRVMSNVTPSDEALTGQGWLNALFQNYREAIKQHPHVSDLIGARLLANAHQNPSLLEGVLTALLEMKCPERHLVTMYNTTVAAMCGFATMEFGHLPQEDLQQWRDQLQAKAGRLNAADYPNLTRSLPQMMNRAFVLRWQNGHEQPMNDSFNRYVDVVLAGLQGQIAAMIAVTEEAQR